MKLFLNSSEYIETDSAIDISIPMVAGERNLRAWYVDPPTMEPVRANGYIGSVKEGGSVNFRNIYFNPHGHGTHTECLGHITEEVYSVNKVLKNYFFKAQVITITPNQIFNEEYKELDQCITVEQLRDVKFEKDIQALVIRTLPNMEMKAHKNYSDTNPAYMQLECMEVINQLGIKHLLLDLPSVDRETDGGKLVFHHAFWGVPDNLDFERTITELIFVEDGISDGIYVLEMQVASFENDASPSRPVLYAVEKV
jgi:arylformamidase